MPAAPVTWIDVQGLGDVEVIRALGAQFGLHALAIADIASLRGRNKEARAVLGAAGAVSGADRLARIEILGQPLGGYELVVGPVTDPNLPWVLLSRALLHLKLMAERNHARRDLLVVEAGTEPPGSTLDIATRGKLEGLFRRIRRERGDDARLRDELAALVGSLVDTP